MIKKCDICGQEFEARSSRQHYCNKPIKARCLACGAEFITKCSDGMKITCGNPECTRISGNLIPLTERICKGCGEKFSTNKKNQVYCGQTRTKKCLICGKDIEYVCGVDFLQTCGIECQVKLIKAKRTETISKETRICKWCGKEFTPTEWGDAYCEGPHYKKCEICGKDFEINVEAGQDKNQTCSKDCMKVAMSQNHDYAKGVITQQKNLKMKYGVTSVMQIPGVQDKIKQTTLERYGKEWYTQTEEYKESVKQTSLKKYGKEHPLQAEEVIAKRMKTCEEKYGNTNIFGSEIGKQKVKDRMLAKYSVVNPSQYPEFKRKATANSKNSKLEVRICNLLDNYDIRYIHHYVIRDDNYSHEFDFYLPDFKLLVDADGQYFHSYLNDPDGGRVRDDYDNIRLKLTPEDHRFYLIVEGDEDKQVKDVVTLLKSIDGDFAKYDSQLFSWCRSIDFPYPTYTKERMMYDYTHLVQYTNDNYVPQCRLGQSIVKHFHHSIYHARVGSSVSPYEGWYDDNKLKQVILNRFIYKNTVDPSKILSGFNMSKICPVVSTFNPVLAKYLILKYLSEFNCIFDPFSGFSGRLIGCAATGKKYVGQDLNSNAVSESNSIIEFLDLNNNDYTVAVRDILESEGSYECLLTCPPYNKKERYNLETEFKTCDEWIDECLTRFKCDRYVFVVDTTDKYKDYIKEDIISSSHLTKAVEHVVVIGDM